MPKLRVNRDAAQFAARLIALLEKSGQKRHGAGSYLAKRYNVSNVVANAWLNGEYKPGLPIAEKIAKDHNSSLDELYFNRKSAPTIEPSWPFDFDRELLEGLSPGQMVALSGVIKGWIIDHTTGDKSTKPALERAGTKKTKAS